MGAEHRQEVCNDRTGLRIRLIEAQKQRTSDWFACKVQVGKLEDVQACL